MPTGLISTPLSCAPYGREFLPGVHLHRTFSVAEFGLFARTALDKSTVHARIVYIRPKRDVTGLGPRGCAGILSQLNSSNGDRTGAGTPNSTDLRDFSR